MLAISVEQQVLTDFIYGCVSQKCGRNFGELVSSASAWCSSEWGSSLRTCHGNLYVLWQGEKGHWTTWPGLQKVWEEVVVLKIFLQTVSRADIAWVTFLFEGVLERSFYSEALHSQRFGRGGCLCRLRHVVEVFLWTECLENSSISACLANCSVSLDSLND